MNWFSTTKGCNCCNEHILEVLVVCNLHQNTFLDSQQVDFAKITEIVQF